MTFGVDQSSLERMMGKTFAGLANLDHAVQGTQIGFDVFSAYRLVPAAPLGLPHSVSTGVYARLIARRQLPDGHWTNDDVRPPQAYSDFGFTAYMLRALQLFLPEEMAPGQRHGVLLLLNL